MGGRELTSFLLGSSQWWHWEVPSLPLLFPSVSLIQSPSLLQGVQVPPCHVGHGWLWTPIPAPVPLCSCCVTLVCSSLLSLRMDFPQKSFTSGDGWIQTYRLFSDNAWDLLMDITSTLPLSKSPFSSAVYLKRYYEHLISLLPKKCILGIGLSPVFLEDLMYFNICISSL